jgi:hypothetical protein
MEVVLRDPGSVEARALGSDDLLDGEPVPIGSGRLFEHPGEEPESLAVGEV